MISLNVEKRKIFAWTKCLSSLGHPLTGVTESDAATHMDNTAQRTSEPSLMTAFVLNMDDMRTET